MNKPLRRFCVEIGACAAAAAVGFVVGGETGAVIGAGLVALYVLARSDDAGGRGKVVRWAARSGRSGGRARSDAERQARIDRWEELSAREYRHPLDFKKHEALVVEYRDEHVRSLEHFNALNQARMEVLYDELESVDRRDKALLDARIAEMDELGAEMEAVIAHSVDLRAACSLNSLAISLAKADGRIARDEFEAFRSVLLEEADTEFVEAVFKYLREVDEDMGHVKEYTGPLVEEFGPGNEILVQVYGRLWAVAVADGAIHSREKAMLAEIARGLQLSPEQIAAVEELHWQPGMSANDPPTAKSDYEVLGIRPGAADREVRAAFRKRVRACHPDTLAGKNVPPEMVAQAVRRMAQINAAYARIREQRGF